MMNDEQIEQWQKMTEVLERWAEAMLPVYHPLFDAIVEWWIAVKRRWFYLRLRRWLPDWLACFLSERWPSRLLPVPDLEKQ